MYFVRISHFEPNIPRAGPISDVAVLGGATGQPFAIGVVPELTLFSWLPSLPIPDIFNRLLTASPSQAEGPTTEPIDLIDAGLLA